MNAGERVQWVYSAKNNQELATRYDDWAATYEHNLFGSFDYTAPEDTAAYFVKYVPHNARILDAGAGTGLVGQLLHQQGYHNLAALDLSAGMLAEARKKGVYLELHQGVLGEPLNFPSDSFDAVISVGVFTLGHAPASAFDELIRLTKPGGFIVFSLNTALNDAFADKLHSLAAAGHWQLVEVSDKFYPMPIGEPDVSLQAWVYKVL